MSGVANGRPMGTEMEQRQLNIEKSRVKGSSSLTGEGFSVYG